MNESRTDHYVQLISNASMDVYPGNVISEFTTQLAQPLRLDGQWEVGMHSCAYHRNWLNLTERKDAVVRVTVTQWGETAGEEALDIIKTHMILPHPGNYSTPESLIQAILNTEFVYRPELETNDTLTKSFPVRVGDLISMKCNQSTQRFRIIWKKHFVLKNDLVKIGFSDKLCKMLGLVLTDPSTSLHQCFIAVGNPERIIPSRETSFPFPPYTRETIRSEFTFTDPINLVDVYNLFIYTDLVRATRLGDADAEYLYMIPVEGKEGAYIHFAPDNVVYKEVVSQSVRTINIKVADFAGDRVKFNHGSGEFTCLLHFRKIA